MGKKFYNPLVFVLFLSSLLLNPQVFAKQGDDVSAKETKSSEKSNVQKKVRSKDGRFIDNGDGTITDANTELMWAKKDSYADLEKCLHWSDSNSYVKKLRTGGYSDWQMPTVAELKSIFEESKLNKGGAGGIVYIDPIFASGSGFMQWSSETKGCCKALLVPFDFGNPFDYLQGSCLGKGVRAVRY